MVVNLRRYVFHSDWDIYAPVDDVYAVIRDQRTYVQWWKEVREATDLGNDRCRVRARSSHTFMAGVGFDRSLLLGDLS